MTLVKNGDVEFELAKALHIVAKNRFGRVSAGKFVATLAGGEWAYTYGGESIGAPATLEVTEMFSGEWDAAKGAWRGPVTIVIE